MLFALVASDCNFAVDLFVERLAAEQALTAALADEPDWADLLSVIAVLTIDEWGRWN